MKYSKNQKGVALILEVVLVAVVLGVIGFAVYTSMNAKQPTAASPTPTPTPTPSPTLTKVLAEGLMVAMPSGWEDSRRTIGGQSYQIRFQLTDKLDYLTYGENGSGNTLIQKTKLASGQDAYVLKGSDQNVLLSSCAPTASGQGCSFRYNGQFMYVALTGAQQPGDQAVRNLDPSNPSTATAIADFEAMVEALKL